MRIIAFADGSFHKKLYIWRPQETSHQKTKLFEAFKATAGSEDFGENLSLKYEHFFAEEYSSLSAYLEAEEELAEEEIEAIIKAEMGDESLWKVDVTICEGYGFANMFDEYIWKEDYLIPRLNEILEN